MTSRFGFAKLCKQASPLVAGLEPNGAKRLPMQRQHACKDQTTLSRMCASSQGCVLTRTTTGHYNTSRDGSIATNGYCSFAPMPAPYSECAGRSSLTNCACRLGATRRLVCELEYESEPCIHTICPHVELASLLSCMWRCTLHHLHR